MSRLTGPAHQNWNSDPRTINVTPAGMQGCTRCGAVIWNVDRHYAAAHPDAIDVAIRRTQLGRLPNGRT